MIKNMDMEYTHGQMDDTIKVDFLTENNTEKVYINKLMEQKPTAYGKKEKKVLYVRIVPNGSSLRTGNDRNSFQF